jgi:demethylmenaquinone methyltransferase/2-methoxy-6-polyprenyl-1,4-benzoquinol methylase
MPAGENRVEQGQLDYYRARAAEYDEWWLRQGRYDRGREANAQWFGEQAVLGAELAAFEPRGKVLELACGTGIWTEKLLAFASSVTAVDGSPEMLELARRRQQSPNVRYVEADLFDWAPDEVFDVVFFSFWLSHVPPERFESFWQLVARCLTRGGRVFFIDSQREPTSTAADHRLPGAESQTLRRRLNDGREFEIYKIFYDLTVLEDRLHALGWECSIDKTERFFIYGSARPILS